MDNNELESFPEYNVRRAPRPPRMKGAWNDPIWAAANTLAVASFHPASSGHRPNVQARMLYDANGLYGMFLVQDRYVVCTHTGYMSRVYCDSCVEFFVQPKPGKGYMNFEMNCGGGLLLYYIADSAPKHNPDDPEDEFADFTKVPREIGSRVRIYHSMPSYVYPEIASDTEWRVEFHIPFSVLEEFVGPLDPVGGKEWRANFNKCADDCSHPHWATWAPIGEKLNLHQPGKFGVLRFT